jgi:heme/copper-type cytochrome/quinol oxidase subunit 2
LTLLFTTTVFGKDVFLSVSGKANGFFTDARILNPSYDKDITVTAQYLVGNNDNTNATSVHITVPKRSMRVFDDAVQSIFGGGAALGAIRLTSQDDFVATQRIYRDARLAPQGGTLGQFVPGFDLASAKRKGVILQLKSGTTTLGNFRTNWGGVNPNSSVANIAFKLYDKNNVVVGTNNLTLQPFGVFSPSNIVDFFGFPTSDLTDAWISFESDVPVFLYGSVVDNGSSDPTFVPASDDSGVAPVVNPPQAKTMEIVAVNWDFDESTSAPLRVGDEVRLTVRADEGTHGFRLFSPSGDILIDIASIGSAERTFRVTEAGTYVYLCTNDGCGIGHTGMNGSFVVSGN